MHPGNTFPGQKYRLSRFIYNCRTGMHRREARDTEKEIAGIDQPAYFSVPADRLVKDPLFGKRKADPIAVEKKDQADQHARTIKAYKSQERDQPTHAPESGGWTENLYHRENKKQYHRC